MGWVWLALIAAATFGFLWRFGVPRSLASFVAAALMLGAAGYALQGRPTLHGSPARASAKGGETDAELAKLRLDLFGRFTYAEPYFAMSDGLARAGDKAGAVKVLLGGVNSARDNAALWTALGTAYAEHDGNRLSPPARLAFDRALKIAPEHPGPPFFLGLALIREGRFQEARPWWARAYRLTPADASYREAIGLRLALLDRLLASDSLAPPPPAPFAPR